MLSIENCEKQKDWIDDTVNSSLWILFFLLFQSHKLCVTQCYLVALVVRIAGWLHQEQWEARSSAPRQWRRGGGVRRRAAKRYKWWLGSPAPKLR